MHYASDFSINSIYNGDINDLVMKALLKYKFLVYDFMTNNYRTETKNVAATFAQRHGNGPSG